MSTKVYLVGAGPGDPELITLKAKKIIQIADVIVYDSLINRRLLELSSSHTEIIYVGKRRGKKKYEQIEINEILVSRAIKGKKVVRLKGGDPFVFGRGGEEGQALRNNNIVFEVVPGVSSITAVPAYAGIPLTHRDYNSSFTVITGHEDPARNESRLDWESISRMETLVILMSLNNTEKIMKKLMEYKMDKNTPVCITSSGTTPEQETITGTISNISKKLKDNPHIKTPAVTLVGNIVNLRNELNWYERKTLFGKKVIVTRPLQQSKELIDLLNSEGAEILEFPTIEISEPVTWSGVDNSISYFDSYDYVIFTSVNGVERFLYRLHQKGADSRIFGGKQIIAIGSKTSSVLEKYGLRADIVPEEYVAEGIISSLENKDISGSRFLIPRAEVARDILPDKLEEMGAEVDVVSCYRTIMPKHDRKRILKLGEDLRNGDIDIVTFTSSSTVSNFFAIFNNLEPKHKRFSIACIGPVTAETVRSHNMTPDIIASEYTVEGMMDAITDHFKSV